MNNKNNGGLKAFLFLVIAGLLISPFISSCGKTSVNVTSSNIQYQVVNLSPSLGPISLYIDYRIYNRLGELIWVDTFLFADFDESGRIIAINQICIDITQQKKAQEKIIENENKYKNKKNDGQQNLKINNPDDDFI